MSGSVKQPRRREGGGGGRRGGGEEQQRWPIDRFFLYKEWEKTAITAPANGKFVALKRRQNLLFFWGGGWRSFSFSSSSPHLNVAVFRLDVPNQQRWHAKWKLRRNMYTLRATFLHVLAPTRMLSRRLVTKISASELRRKFVKGALLVGYATMQKRRERNGKFCRAQKAFAAASRVKSW